MKKLLMFLAVLLLGASGGLAATAPTNLYMPKSIGEDNWQYAPDAMSKNGNVFTETVDASSVNFLYFFISNKTGTTKDDFIGTTGNDKNCLYVPSGQTWNSTDDIVINSNDEKTLVLYGKANACYKIAGGKKYTFTVDFSGDNIKFTVAEYTGGGGQETTHTVTIKWDGGWNQHKPLTYDNSTGYYSITGTAGTDIPGAGTQFALTCDGKDYSDNQEMAVNEKYNAIAENTGNNFTYPTGYTDVTIYFDYNNGTPQVWFTGTPEGTPTPDTTKWGLIIDNFHNGDMTWDYANSTKLGEPAEDGSTTFSLTNIDLYNNCQFAFFNSNNDRYTVDWTFKTDFNSVSSIPLNKQDNHFDWTGGNVTNYTISGKIYKSGSDWKIDLTFEQGSLFPLPTDATITVKGSNNWDTKIQGTYNEATGCFEFNVDYPADTQFAFTYNGNDYTNREDLSEDTWSTNAVGRGTNGQNFKTTSAAKKIFIDNTTGKVKYTVNKPTPENFGIYVGSTPSFASSCQFTKTDGSDEWTLTAEDVNINNGSSIYVLDNNSNRWWIHGEENFRIYGDIENQTLTNAGTTPAPARFHMASATYTINAQITKAEDGTYTLDHVKFTRKKGTVTTPDDWQWGLAFQDLNVSGEWSWGQIEANKDKVPLFEAGTTADGTKAYIFKKTLTLTQGKDFSLYYKDASDNVQQMNFGPNSTNYSILNNRNLLRLHAHDKFNEFGLGTAEYDVTMEVWQENGTDWYCRFDFGGNAEPNTIYLALNKETPENVLNADKSKLAIYAYTNGSDASNAITNGNWPGLYEWKKDNDISTLIGMDVYKATVMPRFLRFVASVDGANQTANLKIVNNGVYFWDDELLPFGIILKDEDGKTAYRRYANTQTEETTKYVYLPASEFNLTKNEDGTYPTVYVNIVDKTSGQQVSGLRGTTKAIPEEYHGKLYYKVPTASIAEGSEIEIEFSLEGGGDENNRNKWSGKCPHCGKNYSEVTDHSACYEECIAGTNSATGHTCSHSADTAKKIIITYPATEKVTFEEGKVFHRYPAAPTNILTDTKPTTLQLCINAEEIEATREDNGIYYFDGEYENSTPFYFKATFGTGEEASTSYYQASTAAFQMLKSIPYSINEATETPNNWLLPTDNGFSYNIVLSWSEQSIWARANSTKAFTSVTPAEIIAVPYASEERSTAATYVTHKDFINETTHFGAAKVTMIHSNNSEYVRPAHIDGFSNIAAGTEANTAELSLAAHTAGEYTLRVTNPASALFDYQVMDTKVTVLPTIESVGLQINGYDVEKEGDAYTIFLREDGEDEFEMNGYVHNNKRAHVGCGEDIIAHKTDLPADDAERGKMVHEAMKANGFKVYFKYNETASEPSYRPAVRAAATSTEGYTEYGAKGVELDMTKAKTNGISFIVEENGVKSNPVTINNFSVPTGIDEIGEEEAAEPIYFDLQGFPVKNPEKGIYIRVINGKADKVLF